MVLWKSIYIQFLKKESYTIFTSKLKIEVLAIKLIQSIKNTDS